MFTLSRILFFSILLAAFIVQISFAQYPEKGKFIRADPDSVRDVSKISRFDVAAAEAFADTLKKEILSDEIISVPKKHIYTLVSFLLLMIVIVQFSRHRPLKHKIPRRDKRKPESVITKNNSAFVSYVISLFDPHQFQLRTHNKDFPDLHVATIKDGSGFRFAIETFYLQKLTGLEVIAFSPDQIARYLDYQERNGAEVYAIIGIEGEPSFPKEVYVIKAVELGPGRFSYQHLQPFRKFGMFSCHSGSGRLQ